MSLTKKSDLSSPSFCSVCVCVSAALFSTRNDALEPANCSGTKRERKKESKKEREREREPKKDSCRVKQKKKKEIGSRDVLEKRRGWKFYDWNSRPSRSLSRSRRPPRSDIINSVNPIQSPSSTTVSWPSLDFWFRLSILQHVRFYFFLNYCFSNEIINPVTSSTTTRISPRARTEVDLGLIFGSFENDSIFQCFSRKKTGFLRSPAPIFQENLVFR